jgi:hypothetical protein
MNASVPWLVGTNWPYPPSNPLFSAVGERPVAALRSVSRLKKPYTEVPAVPVDGPWTVAGLKKVTLNDRVDPLFLTVALCISNRVPVAPGMLVGEEWVAVMIKSPRAGAIPISTTTVTNTERRQPVRTRMLDLSVSMVMM